MARLSELTLKTSYHRGEDDIARDFYLPCMRRATRYDRAVGFFRSTAYAVAWPALRDFVQRGAQMRILCSHVLAEADITALEEGYSGRANSRVAARLAEEVRSLLQDPVLRGPARVLAALVARGTIDLKVAVMSHAAGAAEKRIFHDKLGIFHDAEGDAVVFKGSMNETWSGLSSDGNLESIDVAATWLGQRDLDRARREMAYLEDMWADTYPGLIVRDFPDVARNELVSQAAADWEADLERLLEGAGDAAPAASADPFGRTLRPHQAAALASWKANGRRGVLEHATGSGKTFTAITAILESLRAGEVPLIVVPDNTLFEQWHQEIEAVTAGLGPRILRCGAGHSAWREDSLLRPWTEAAGEPRIILATLPTASKESFAASFRGGDHILLVIDEAHRAGSHKFRQVLDLPAGPRLGLSATPRRAGDPSGTAVLLDALGGILEPRYLLEDAIRDGVLSKYFYRAHTTRLSMAEAENWRDFSTRIGRLYAQLKKDGTRDDLRGRIRMLLIQRADILKGAAGKVELAANVLHEHFVRGQRWIVYCDDSDQLRQVVQRLTNDSLEVLEYHSQMAGDRRETLRWLERVGGIVVAIKCLDEGVDIPAVSHALILASSKNPREYIQRRGRVLRRHSHKALAYIHDAVVLPPDGFRESGAPDPIVAGELARGIQFSRNAENPAAATDLERIAIDWGLDWPSLVEEGIEDEE